MTDIIARAVADRLQAAWKHAVVIENVSGATGAIGAAQAARAVPDGYTLLLGTGTTNTILPALRSNLQFDPINDFAPISLIARFPNMLVVRPDVPATSVQELIDLVTANPGKYTFASSGHGSSIHLAGEMFKLMTKADILHVPYTGSAPAVTALLGGHVDMMFDTMPTVWPYAQTGKLRALGVASLKRTPLAPDVPAISETLPGFDVTSWLGLMAPARTPEAIQVKIAGEIERIVRDRQFAEQLREASAIAESNSPQEFLAYMQTDYAKWRRVVQEAGIKVD